MTFGFYNSEVLIFIRGWFCLFVRVNSGIERGMEVHDEITEVQEERSTQKYVYEVMFEPNFSQEAQLNN